MFKFKSKTELELSREGQKISSSTLENSCTKDLWSEMIWPQGIEQPVLGIEWKR